MKGSVGLLSIAMTTIDFGAIFINFVQFWINFHSFTWHWLDPYFVSKKMLFDRQETLSCVLESTTAFVIFRQKAFFKLNFTVRNRVPLHFTIRNRVPHNKKLTNRACSGRTGEYWPSVVAVRTERSEVRTATTEAKRLRATSVKQGVRTGTWLRNHLYWYWYPWIAYSMASRVVYFFFFYQRLFFFEKSQKYWTLPTMAQNPFKQHAL